MNNKPIFIAFASQKGGVGKSTIAELTASILHYRFKTNVLLVDCDFPQITITKLREREQEQVNYVEDFAKKIYAYYDNYEAFPYRIITAEFTSAIEQVEAFLADAHYPVDVVLFDLHGGRLHPEGLDFLLQMDYVVSPVKPDTQTVNSCLAFALILAPAKLENISPTPQLKKIMMLWNDLNKNAQTVKSVAIHTQQFEEHQIAMMETRLENSINYAREQYVTLNGATFLSTLLPPDRELLRRSNLMAYVKELAGTVGIELEERIHKNSLLNTSNHE